MKKRVALVAVILGLVLGLASGARAGRTEGFLQDLFRRFAYRPATPSELQYWGRVVETMDPDRAETRLRHWFFVHAAYKTSLGRTVTIFDVERTVDLLDAGRLDYRAVQYSIFSSPEYQQAKRRGLAGTMMIPLPQDPS